jgi:hypothetical protein
VSQLRKAANLFDDCLEFVVALPTLFFSVFRIDIFIFVTDKQPNAKFLASSTNLFLWKRNGQQKKCSRDILIVVSIYPKTQKKRVETFSCVSTNIGYFLFFLFVVEIDFFFLLVFHLEPNHRVTENI